jgi:UBA/TS-N domain
MSDSRISRIFSTIKESLTRKKTSKPLVTSETQILKLKVISTNFGVIVVDITDTENGSFAKKSALEIFSKVENFPYFTSSNEIDDSMIKRFKIIRVKTRKEIDGLESLKEMKIQNNEEFLMLAHRTAIPDPIDHLNLAGPTEDQILEKTALLPKSQQLPPPFNTNEMLLQDDMRKVFVTLAKESAYILGTLPFADSLIAYYRQRIHNYIKNDKNAVNVMVKLGFEEDRVQHAMTLSANNYKLALDWLIENETSTGPHDSILEKSPRESSVSSSLVVTSARRNSILSSNYFPTCKTKDRIDGLLEIVNFFSEKEEIVYEENIGEMNEIGFDTETARDALRVTHNNIAAAIAHIQGDENPSITELRDGLAPTSTIRKKFFESPQILLSLGKPQYFALFINVLDNPTQANVWNPFSEIGSLMTHIIITYHEEKHINATNQFNQSRLPISALSAPT